MISDNLSRFIKGWFVGNFEPSLIKTNDVEVGVKTYNKDDYEENHFHKIATEITVVISGSVAMNNKIYKSGDIIIIRPYEHTNFKALEPSTCVVVKYPGANNDKYVEVLDD